MFNTDIVLVFLLAIIVAITIWIAFLDTKLRRALRGKSGNIDECIRSLDKDIREIKNFRGEIETYLVTVEKRLKSSVQGIGTIRFNAFDSAAQGGNQSFASAFLDENRNGVVISGIHARGFVGIYAKPIEKGTSKHDLSDEEKQAINKALGNMIGGKQMTDNKNEIAKARKE